MDNSMITKDSIIHFFKKSITHPVSFKDICVRLELVPSERRKLKRILREIISDGEIVRTRKGLYGPAEEMHLVTGVFEAHREGYGFVILEKPGERDIFIPSRGTAGAMDNDRVVARIENRQRREGRIIRVLQRASTQVVGTFESGISAGRRAGGFFVRPKKRRAIPFDIYISPKDKGKAKDGDNVIAEIIDYPSDKRPPIGRVVKILKKPQSPKDEIDIIIDEFNLPLDFPEDVMEEAGMLYSQFSSDRAFVKKGDGEQRRKDLRNLPTVTIDGERAKDFDDAVSIKTMNGGYTLWVHIADVGYYVKWDSLIDMEARKRGASVYFPGRVIPMLPKELSEDICSLKPRVDRNAFTIEMDFDNRGEMVNSRFYSSVINSNERMTYTSLKNILVDRNHEEMQRYEYLLGDFELMGELCGKLKSRRLKRGSLDFDLPEPEVLLDIQGNPEAIIKSERNFAHMIIEEFMIAANEAVAAHLEGMGVNNIYRIHEEPDPLKMEELMKIVNMLTGQNSRKSLKSLDFSGLLAKIKGTSEEEIISHIILRSLKQARYSTVNVGHFGLASDSYSHFTSPIRRYPDLVVHRILKEVLTKKRLSDKRIKQLEAILPDIAFHSSKMERQADDAERAVLSAYRVWFMKDKVGEEFLGKVVSVTSHGLKVRFVDYYVEGFLHVSYMTDDFYEYDERTISLHGVHKKKRYTIGSELKVRIDRVDTEEREIILGI